MPSKPSFVTTHRCSVTHQNNQAYSKNETSQAGLIQKNYSKARKKTLSDLRTRIDECKQDFPPSMEKRVFIRNLIALHSKLERLQNNYPSWMIHSIARQTEVMLARLLYLLEKPCNAEEFKIESEKAVLDYQCSLNKLFEINHKINAKYADKDKIIYTILTCIVGTALGALLGPYSALSGAGIGIFIGNKITGLFFNRALNKTNTIEKELAKNLSEIVDNANAVLEEIDYEEMSAVIISN